LDIEDEPDRLPEPEVPAVLLVSVLAVPLVEPVPEAPMEVPLPVLDESVLEPVVPPEAMLLELGEVVLLESALVEGEVEGVEDTPEPVVLDVVEEVEVSVVLRSPQAASDRAATRARAAQRARGVAFIRTLLERFMKIVESSCTRALRP
jgi:hypothetical protein